MNKRIYHTRPPSSRPKQALKFLCVAALLLGAIPVFSQVKNPTFDLKKLSVEELMNIEVTSVSKSPEKLTEVASAIQVITNEDIKRSAATRLPEALRLAPNLQVAQSNSHDWAITARGFNGAPLQNNTLADKLLVMIDGRSVYTPLFGGVFWDVQNVMLEDIDRVEVVSGPGGTLWGANAVNGVINIITKSAAQTQGLLVTAMPGSFLEDRIGVRYGGRIDSNFYFRVYGQHFDQASSHLPNGNDAQDQWNMTQGGFRADYTAGSRDQLMIQGDFYGGKEDTAGKTGVNGQDVVAKWSHHYSRAGELVVQAYFDRTWRNLTRSVFTDRVNSYDLDIQRNFSLNRKNRIICGITYRYQEDQVNNIPGLVFTPETKELQLFSGFVQDQVSIIPHRLDFTVGTKLLHNDYTGFEWQPSVRMAWTPSLNNTIWAAVSRAVRTPSRLDVEAQTTTLFTPPGSFLSENVMAYELGYRLRPVENLNFSIATFYNDYRDLRSINTNPSAPPAFIFANGQKAQTWGLEISGNAVISEGWRLRGGYTFMNKQFQKTSPNVISGSDLFEGIDPNNQVLIQSITDLGRHLRFDWSGRYVDNLVQSSLTAGVSSYITLDARIAWDAKHYTISIAGQNLLQRYHAEFGTRQIPSSVYARICVRF